MDAVPKELRIAYVQSAPSKLTALNELWKEAQSNGWNPQTREALVELTHRLAGSGGSYGYPDLSVAARRLELMLKELQSAPADTTQLEEACQGLASVLDAVAQSPVD